MPESASQGVQAGMQQPSHTHAEEETAYNLEIVHSVYHERNGYSKGSWCLVASQVHEIDILLLDVRSHIPQTDTRKDQNDRCRLLGHR